MRGIDQGAGNVAIQSRQGDVEARLQEIATLAMTQVDQPAAKSCSGLVPAPAAPGEVRSTSRRPSELRAAPSRPPVVWVRPV